MDGSQIQDVRIQPHNIEAEQALLGALLLNNDIYEQIETCEPPTDGTCCLDEGQHICRCGTQTECGELGVPVPSCEVDLLGCFTGLDSVDACVE